MAVFWGRIEGHSLNTDLGPPFLLRAMLLSRQKKAGFQMESTKTG